MTYSRDIIRVVVCVACVLVEHVTHFTCALKLVEHRDSMFDVGELLTDDDDDHDDGAGEPAEQPQVAHVARAVEAIPAALPANDVLAIPRGRLADRL